MTMKQLLKLVFAFGILLTTFDSFSQEFVFRYEMKEMDDVLSAADIKDHFLGEDVSRKMQLLKESYTYFITDEVSNTERRQVEKPAIYNSVNKVSRYLKKQVKKGGVTKADATQKFDAMLNAALNIRYADTAELEDVLWEIKDPKRVMDLFVDNITLEM